MTICELGQRKIMFGNSFKCGPAQYAMLEHVNRNKSLIFSVMVTDLISVGKCYLATECNATGNALTLVDIYLFWSYIAP